MLPQTILALDVGEKRIGIAVANLATRLPQPLATLANDETFTAAFQALLDEHHPIGVVVGLPRSLEGNTTPQTARTTTFAETLKQQLSVPVYLQDEALTSVKAREELETRGKPYNKGEVDALAATYILEDFLGEKEDERNYDTL